MNPTSGKNSHRSDERDELFADALERQQELDSDEELEAALHQELIDISDCNQPLGSEFDKAGEKTKSLR
jgi:hypothetical protein